MASQDQARAERDACALVGAFARYLRRLLAEAPPGTPRGVVLVGPEDNELPAGAEEAAVALVLGSRDPEWIQAARAQAGLTVQFEGKAVAGDGRGGGGPTGSGPGPGIPLTVLDRWDRSSLPPVPPELDVLAVVTTYNEADIVEGLLDRLLGEGLRVQVVDNWSTDGTYELVQQRLGSGPLTLERFPAEGPSPHFELERLLERVEEIAHRSGADWVVHHDADEIREPPWAGSTLREGLHAVGHWGFDCVDHTVVNFVPTDDRFSPGDDLAASFAWCELGDAPGHFLQQKAWKPRPERVAMAFSGGHELVTEGRRTFPYKFLTRHYPIRSQAHGERKILLERRRRFSPAERARGWHAHYDHYFEGSSFLGDPAELVPFAALERHLLVQRLSGVGLPGNPFPGESAEAVAAEAGRLAAEQGSGSPTAQRGAHGAGAAGGTAATGALGERPAPVLLRVQTVLYAPGEHPLGEGPLSSFLRGLRQASTLLTRTRPEVRVELALGDCSPGPALGAEELERLRWSFTGTGTTAVYYEHFGENLGHGAGQQRLLAGRAGAAAVVLLNPDAVASPRLLLELLEGLGSPDDRVGVVEARHLPLEHQKAYDPRTGETSWASGACSLVSAEVLDATGGFDTESFFLYCDDVDLSWRARLAGFRVVHRPSAVVFHDKRLSPSAAQVPGETERYHSALASLLLYAKFSRPDLLQKGLDAYDESPDPVHARAAAELRRRLALGLLPEPIDAEGKVADFSTYAYAPLRFDYSRALPAG